MAAVSAGRVARVIATVWTDPAQVRDIDAPVLAAEPDIAGWIATLTVADRLDLHGRVLTQALPGEPVLVDTERDGWAAVVLPWQPSSLDSRGYPGWVRLAQLTVPTMTATPAGHHRMVPAAKKPLDARSVVATARGFLGLDYLWGGFSRYGVDCSGLVSLTFRDHGVFIPRDARDQATGGTSVELAELRPGDLVFFGDDEGRGAVHHVGMAVGDGTMVHAPRTGRTVELCSLTQPGYVEELCAARRYLP